MSVCEVSNIGEQSSVTAGLECARITENKIHIFMYLVVHYSQAHI